MINDDQKNNQDLSDDALYEDSPHDFDDSYTESDEGDIDFDEGSDEFMDDEMAMDEENQSEHSSLNIFNLFIFGILFVGFIGISIFYLPNIIGGFFGQNTPQNQENLANRQQNQIPQVQEEVVTPLNEQIAQSGGLLSNPDILNDVENQQAVEEANQEIGEEIFADLNLEDLRIPSVTNDNLDINMVADDESDLIVATEAQPLPVPSDDPVMNVQVDLPEDNGIIFEPLEPQIPVTTNTAAPVQNNDAIAEQIETLSVDLKLLSETLRVFMTRVESRGEEMENRITQAEEMASQTSQISTLQSTIANLEKRIEAMQENQSAQTAPVMRDQTQQQTPRPEPEPVAEPQQVQTNTADPAPTPRVRTPRPAPRNVNWALRGASRGEAIITDTNSGAVQTVSVGDTVQGLGRITAIEVNNNRWVVQGTQGAVRQ